MGQIRVLQNPVKNYAWGSYTTIPSLLGRKSPSDQPCAEMWMGAHPDGTSRVIEQELTIPLNEWIQAAPESRLGRQVTASSGTSFPFLFKVLAAEAPLSIQAHPDSRKAREGFLREERAGIPRDAPERNYKDVSHKPECLCALTPFAGLCGFRRIPDILDHLRTLLPGSAREIGAPLTRDPGPSGLKSFLRQLMVMDQARIKGVLAEGAERAETLKRQDPAYEWVTRLCRAWPGDIMALAPAFLNFFLLQPGQALFLGPGVIHSYLNGSGMELMANSDNVLRGGLTHKHVAVEELLNILDFSEQQAPQVLSPVAVSGCESVYHADTDAFELSVMRVVPEQDCRGRRSGNVEILLCTAGSGEIFEVASGETTEFNRGTSLLIPADFGAYGIAGNAELYKATVPA
ncbi:MAG: mannose-6-phosphate isomerase, class I [Desulfosudaceae bacterium]